MDLDKSAILTSADVPLLMDLKYSHFKANSRKGISLVEWNQAVRQIFTDICHSVYKISQITSTTAKTSLFTILDRDSNRVIHSDEILQSPYFKNLTLAEFK